MISPKLDETKCQSDGVNPEVSQLDEEATVKKQVSWTSSNQEVTFLKDDPPARLSFIPVAPNSLPNLVPNFVSCCSTPSTSMDQTIPVATPANTMGQAKANHDLVWDLRDSEEEGHDGGGGGGLTG